MNIEEHNVIHDAMKNQPTINIGTVGHVAHGKTTIVKCITGINTIKYKSELEKNITIKLGYANSKIYECNCVRPSKYSTNNNFCTRCNSSKKLIRHISFVDCPGHDVLMATMLNGTAIMDAALLLVAANEPCPQPQTTEHLFALEIMNLKKILVLQNKIDLNTKEQTIEQCEQIKDFLNTAHITAPIIPVSGQFNANIDAVLDFLVNYFDIPERNLTENPKMVIIRSFDVNKPGINYKQLSGAIIGGTIVRGKISLDDEIEIRPGIVKPRDEGFVCTPFLTKVVSLYSETTRLEYAISGGLIGVGTNLDPFYSKSDKLVGMVMGLKNKMPPIYYEITVKYQLFEKIINAKKQEIDANEQILLNISSSSTGCTILQINNDKGVFRLHKPCCVGLGERIAISRKIRGSWRLIGHGTIVNGVETQISYE